MKSRYQKAGMKTVLPAEASAKVDFRLVPDQEPEDILSKLRTHLDAEGFNDVEITALAAASEWWKSMCSTDNNVLLPLAAAATGLPRDESSYSALSSTLSRCI